MRSWLRTLLVCALPGLVVVGCGGPDRTAGPAGHTAGPARGAAAEPTPPPTTVVSDPSHIAPPAGPTEAARALTRVERALRSDPEPTPEVGRALGWEQQSVYGALLAHPEWVTEVLGALPPDVAGVVEGNIAAGRALTSPDLGPAPRELPDWTIRTPQPAAALLGYYREAEGRSGIPWAYLAAIHLVETRMGRIQGNSSAGAQGPMQFIPSTWAVYGDGDVRDDRDAILAAGRYLAAAGGPADMARAVFAYNHSDRYVEAIQAYASVLLADPRAYRGYYHWQVYVRTTDGVTRLPEGWSRSGAAAAG